MSDPTVQPSIRQQIVDALKAQLKTITVANGYSIDIGNSVWDWRDLVENPLQVSDCPAITFEDGDAEMETADMSGNTFNHLPVTIILHVADSTTAPTVRNGINDITTCIKAESALDDLITYYVPISHSIDLHQVGEVIGAGTYEIKITYQAPRGQI